MFLALVSVERVYAVLWPLRHRVTRMRAYILSIAMVWGASLCIAALSLLTVYHAQVDILYAMSLLIFSFSLLSLLSVQVTS